MKTLFIICFGVGAGFVILSFLLGELLGVFGIGGDGGDGLEFDGDSDLDFGAAGMDGLEAPDVEMPDFDVSGLDAVDVDVSGLDAVGGLAPSPLKPRLLAAILTVFGGIGLLLYDRLNILNAVMLAFAGGIAIGWILYRFIITPLYKLQNTSTVSKQSMVGKTAKVTESILQGGFGKITYVVNDNTYSAPAKAEDGSAIGRGAFVEIVYIVRNAYFVREKKGGA